MSDAMLLAAAKRALAVIEEDYVGLLDSHCLKDDAGQPRLDTIDPRAEHWAREYRETIAELEAAIGAAEGRAA